MLMRSVAGPFSGLEIRFDIGIRPSDYANIVRDALAPLPRDGFTRLAILGTSQVTRPMAQRIAAAITESEHVELGQIDRIRANS